MRRRATFPSWWLRSRRQRRRACCTTSSLRSDVECHFCSVLFVLCLQPFVLECDLLRDGVRVHVPLFVVPRNQVERWVQSQRDTSCEHGAVRRSRQAEVVLLPPLCDFDRSCFRVKDDVACEFREALVGDKQQRRSSLPLLQAGSKVVSRIREVAVVEINVRRNISVHEILSLHEVSTYD